MSMGLHLEADPKVENANSCCRPPLNQFWFGYSTRVLTNSFPPCQSTTTGCLKILKSTGSPVLLLVVKGNPASTKSPFRVYKICICLSSTARKTTHLPLVSGDFWTINCTMNWDACKKDIVVEPESSLSFVSRLESYSFEKESEKITLCLNPKLPTKQKKVGDIHNIRI